MDVSLHHFWCCLASLLLPPSFLLPILQCEGQGGTYLCLLNIFQENEDPEWLLLLLVASVLSLVLLACLDTSVWSFDSISKRIDIYIYISRTRRSFPSCGASRSRQCATVTKGRQVLGLGGVSSVEQCFVYFYLCLAFAKPTEKTHACRKGVVALL